MDTYYECYTLGENDFHDAYWLISFRTLNELINYINMRRVNDDDLLMIVEKQFNSIGVGYVVFYELNPTTRMFQISNSYFHNVYENLSEPNTP